MENLALHKLPLEGDIWKRSKEATDGNSTNYTTKSGFAFAYWPCTYTLDLGTENLIRCIRFLLWDNLGNQQNKLDPRKYKFTLSISLDGKTFTPIYTNQNQDGGNGWYSFNFLNDTNARFVRLSGHFNSANKEFHIVEFEVYNGEPLSVLSTNIHTYDISGSLPNIEIINELIDRAISNKVELLQGVEEKIGLLDTSLRKSNETLQNLELIKKSHDFLKESIENNSRSKKWMVVSIIVFVAFIIFLIWLIYFDNHSITVLADALSNDITKEYTSILLIAYYVAKVFLLSVILFMLTWCLKNYRSERHNYVINKHKAMTLTVATSILSKKDYSNVENAKVFNQATEIVFTHQISGYSNDDENTTPNIVNTILQKGFAKVE